MSVEDRKEVAKLLRFSLFQTHCVSSACGVRVCAFLCAASQPRSGLQARRGAGQAPRCFLARDSVPLCDQVCSIRKTKHIHGLRLPELLAAAGAMFAWHGSGATCCCFALPFPRAPPAAQSSALSFSLPLLARSPSPCPFFLRHKKPLEEGDPVCGGCRTAMSREARALSRF